MQARKLEEGSRRSEWAERLLREHERMRAVPGIWFMDSASGRVACINRTGIKVHIVIRTLRDVEWDELRLAKVFSWLTWGQLDAAIRYYEAFPQEIDEAIAEADSWTIERIQALNAEIQAIRAQREA
jgi:uncharacterized protein (DUF433 family)